MSDDLPRHLTLKEVKYYVGLARNAVLEMIANGEFPNAYRANIRGDWRIPKSDIDAWIKRQQEKPKDIPFAAHHMSNRESTPAAAAPPV